MNKKGFTLVELIAIIVILGVVLVIAIPTVSNIVENSRIESFNKSEVTMIEAAKGYMLLNTKYIPANIGDTTEITVAEMQASKTLGVIVNPWDGSEKCSGYVLITKVADKEYTYHPYLNCDNNIGSSADDKLIARYTFDDFQEPTENIFNLNIHDRCWSSGSSNACSLKTTTGNHSFSVKGTSNVPGAYAYIYPYFNSVAGSHHSFSAKVKNNDNEKLRVGIRIRDDSNGDNLSSNDTFYIAPGETKQIYVSTNTANLANRVTAAISVYSNASTAKVNADIFDLQLERKPYITEFTPNVRDGIVKDYSTYNNHANIQLSNAPKWIKESMQGNGAYEFDGVADYINTNQQLSFNKSDSFSVSFWFNPEDHSHKETAAAGLIGKGHWYNNTWDIFLLNNNKLRFECSGDPTRNGITVLDTPVLQLQKWHHYTATYNNGNIKVYLNGELIGTKMYNGTGNFDGDRPVIIGSRFNDLSRSFKGLMDDIRIYKRELLSGEINGIYKLGVR